MSDGKNLKPDEEWSEKDDEVFKRYFKSENHKILNSKACTGCEW